MGLRAVRSRRVTVLAAVFGGAAVVAMVAIGGAPAVLGGADQSVVAGSGDGSAGGVFKQPAAPGMSMGATATWTAPSSVVPTAKAVPAH